MNETVKEVVQKYFPEANDVFLDYIIWSKTGFPAFLEEPSIRTFRKQLALFRRAYNQGKNICYGCGKIFQHKKSLDELCPNCEKELKKRCNALTTSSTK